MQIEYLDKLINLTKTQNFVLVVAFLVQPQGCWKNFHIVMTQMISLKLVKELLYIFHFLNIQ